jgi:hypothetical protein
MFWERGWSGRIVVKSGLKVDFERRTGNYREPTNQSAVKHMDVVIKKVAEWEAGGYLERLVGHSAMVLQPTQCAG